VVPQLDEERGGIAIQIEKTLRIDLSEGDGTTEGADDVVEVHLELLETFFLLRISPARLEVRPRRFNDQTFPLDLHTTLTRVIRRESLQRFQTCRLSSLRSHEFVDPVSTLTLP
jgi:hypothetical protein